MPSNFSYYFLCQTSITKDEFYILSNNYGGIGITALCLKLIGLLSIYIVVKVYEVP